MAYWHQNFEWKLLILVSTRRKAFPYFQINFYINSDDIQLLLYFINGSTLSLKGLTNIF